MGKCQLYSRAVLFSIIARRLLLLSGFDNVLVVGRLAQRLAHLI